MRSTSKKPKVNPVMPLAAITLRFPDGSWEYCATERVPEAGDTLVRAGVTWIVVGVTEAVDDHRVVTMAAPAPAPERELEAGGRTNASPTSQKQRKV